MGGWFREGGFRQEDKLERECHALKWEQMKAQMRAVALEIGRRGQT